MDSMTNAYGTSHQQQFENTSQGENTVPQKQQVINIDSLVNRY